MIVVINKYDIDHPNTMMKKIQTISLKRKSFNFKAPFAKNIKAPLSRGFVTRIGYDDINVNVCNVALILTGL